MPDKLKLPPGAKLVDENTPLPPGATLINAGAPEEQPVKPTITGDPRAFLRGRIQDLQDEAQRQQGLYLGPEGDAITASAKTPIAKGMSYLERFGHGVLSYAPATAAMLDKAVLGASEWKNAIPIASGAVNPAIPAAYFGTQGTASLLGVNQPSSAKAAIGNPSPENVQNALTDASMVAGGASGATGPRPSLKPAIMRGIDRIALGKMQPEALLTKSLKPPVTYPEFEDVAKVRLPEVVGKIQQSGKPFLSVGVKGIRDIFDELAQEKNQQYQNLISPFRTPAGGVGPYRQANIDATPVANAQVASIPPLDLFERPNKQITMQRGGHHIVEGDPGILEKTSELASPFRRITPIGDLDAIRIDSNAKLKSFYDKAGGDQYAALSNPETARMKAINDTTRDLVYDRLEKETGVNPRPIQNAFGDYTDLGNVAGKRTTVYSRQQPFPLQEQISAADALAHGNPVKYGMARLFSRYGDSDAMTGIALDRAARGLVKNKPAVLVRRPAIGSIAASIGRRDNE